MQRKRHICVSHCFDAFLGYLVSGVDTYFGGKWTKTPPMGIYSRVRQLRFFAKRLIRKVYYLQISENSMGTSRKAG